MGERSAWGPVRCLCVSNAPAVGLHGLSSLTSYLMSVIPLSDAPGCVEPASDALLGTWPDPHPARSCPTSAGARSGTCRSRRSTTRRSATSSAGRSTWPGRTLCSELGRPAARDERRLVSGETGRDRLMWRNRLVRAVSKRTSDCRIFVRPRANDPEC